MKKVIVPEMACDNYMRPGYKAMVSPQLARYDDGSFIGRKTQEEAILLLGNHGLVFPPVSLLYSLVLDKGADSPFFYDIFGINKEMETYIELTATKLRTPKGWGNGRKENDGTFPREILEWLDGDWSLVYEQHIPSCGINHFPQYILEINPLSGLPTRTTGKADHKHLDMWWFDPSLKENIVLFYSQYAWRDLLYPPHDCNISMDASHGPAFAADNNKFNIGFRPVRGSIPTVEKIAKIHEKETREHKAQLASV